HFERWSAAAARGPGYRGGATGGYHHLDHVWAGGRDNDPRAAAERTRLAATGSIAARRPHRTEQEPGPRRKRHSRGRYVHVDFGRNSALDARNFFDQQLPPFRRHQFGGAVGGPIKTDKLFFFANYEGLRQFLSESFTSFTLSPNARNGILANGTTVKIDPRVAPYLALFPVPNDRITGDTGKYVFGAGQLGIENYAIGRMDFLSTANTTIYGTYVFDTSHSTTPDAYNNRIVGDRGRHQRFTLSLQHVFSPALLNTINVGISRTVGTGNIDAQAIRSIVNDK